MAFDNGENPIDLISKIKQLDFGAFHNDMWNGAISLADTEAKWEYALLHWEEFRVKAQTKRFEESLRVVSRHHG